MLLGFFIKLSISSWVLFRVRRRMLSFVKTQSVCCESHLKSSLSEACGKAPSALSSLTSGQVGSRSSTFL